jgi:transcriptional regulator of NAD metabolism
VDRAADKYKGRVLGPRFDIYDPRGNLVPENRPVDLSKLGRDVPTTTTSESARRRGLGGVTLNNTTHYHIYGGDDHKIAALHRQHVDHLMRNLQEAKWRQDRANFDGAMAT